MDYKKVFKSPKSRERMLEFLRFIPDNLMLKLQYKIKTGKNLNMKDPQRFTEKLQWYKVNYRNPVMHKCVDKFEVRDYIRQKGLADILVELIGKYNSVSEIDWEKLPESFVIKTINGGGGLNVFICLSKKNCSLEKIKAKFSDVKLFKTRTGGREWAYYGLQPGIVIEQLLINKEDPSAGINDYKFFCYNGKPKYIVVDVDRYIEHKRNFYDIFWNDLHIISDCRACDRDIAKPENLNEMLSIAAKLSEDFPFVRVDLYNVGGKVYFGELTFYPWSGYVQYSPDNFDFELGKQFVLPEITQR